MIFFNLLFLLLLASCDESKKNSYINKQNIMTKDLLDYPIQETSSSYFINITKSLVYESLAGSYPNAVFLLDYPKSAEIKQHAYPLLALKLFSNYYNNLPQNIKQELQEKNIVSDNVDIFIVAQALSFLGEKEDHQGKNSSEYTTRISAHTWLDPNMPNKFVGTRLLDRVDIAVFNSQFSIDDEVKSNKFNDFEINIHDSVLSPRTAGIKIDTSKSQYFYSVVIKDNKAAVTLHILFNTSDESLWWSLFDEKSPLTLKDLLLKVKKSTLKNLESVFKLLNFEN